MKKENIYIVTHGEYSEYSILGVFKDKGIAKEYAKQCDGQVEKYGILNESAFYFPVGCKGYQVIMPKDGNIFDCLVMQHYKQFADYWSTDQHDGYTVKRVMYILSKKGEKGAIKIANERRVQLIANNEWPDTANTLKTPTPETPAYQGPTIRMVDGKITVVDAEPQSTKE